MKKILSFALVVLLTLSLVACGESEEPSKQNKPIVQVDTSLKKGEVSPEGDVFELPDVKQAEGAPKLAEISKQANPGDSILVSGEGFKGANVKFYVYAQTTKDNGKVYEAKATIVDDTYASVLIDEKLPYGMYAVYAENASGKSNLKIVNKPLIWTAGFHKVSAGETFTLLGENFTTENGNKAHAYFVSEDGKQYCEAGIAEATPGKLEIITPEGLKAGAKYKVLIHNGHGGKEGLVESPKKIEYQKEPVVQFKGDVIDVTKYGADAYDRTNDDTAAIKKAVKKVKDGDILYFPPGSYLVTETIDIQKDVKILGADAEKTIIYAGYNIEGAVLKMQAGYAEITGITLEQRRSKGKIKAQLIYFSSVAIDEGFCRLYIHDNIFIQSVSAKSRSYEQVITVGNTYGVKIENNKFESPGLLAAGSSKQVYFRNNVANVTMMAGVYYGSDTNQITNVNGFDASNNIICGKGATRETGSGVIEYDGYLNGRAFVFQGATRNVHIYKNDFVRAGLVDCNAGEQLLFESFDWLCYTKVASATKDTVTVNQSDRNKTVVTSIISILSGKGKGQYRTVTKRAGNTFTVDRPWDIIPDQTSQIVVNNHYYNVMICDNYFDAQENWQDHPSSTVGLSIYGPCQNLFFIRNEAKNLNNLVDVTPMYWFQGGYDTICPVTWNYFDGNKVSNSGRGISMNVTVNAKTGEIPHSMCFGNVFRRNEFKDMKEYTKTTGSAGCAIYSGYAAMGNVWVGAWEAANLFENNTFENCAVTNVNLGPHQANNIYRKNVAKDNTALYNAISGSYGKPIEATY